MKRSTQAVLLLTGVASLFAAPLAGQSATVALRTVTLRSDGLLGVQRDVKAKRPEVRKAYERLLRDAEKLAALPVVAVTDKRTLVAPSGDSHDYFSLSPYWWPDSTKKDGLPYIRRDGVTNPESKADLDQPRMAQLGERMQVFALAWWLSGDPKYAELALTQLRTWFVDPATRMTPHLRYAQHVRGNDAERGSGIIDSRNLIDVADAVGLLERAPGWTAADDVAVRQWFRAYLTWLMESTNGASERKAKNNHGSWFAAQTSVYALFVGDTVLARQIVRDVEARIGWQIAADGRQAEEMARTRSLHYTNFNVEALSRIAEVGRTVGVDLWHYVAPTGGSLTASFTLMAPFVADKNGWPGEQLDAVSARDLMQSFRRARVALNDAALEKTLSKLPADVVEKDRSLLLFRKP